MNKVITTQTDGRIIVSVQGKEWEMWLPCEGNESFVAEHPNHTIDIATAEGEFWTVEQGMNAIAYYMKNTPVYDCEECQDEGEFWDYDSITPRKCSECYAAAMDRWADMQETR